MNTPNINSQPTVLQLAQELVENLRHKQRDAFRRRDEAQLQADTFGECASAAEDVFDKIKKQVS